MKSWTDEQNMWHSWTCGIIGSSSIFDISLKNKKIIQGIRVDLRVLMPVIGVPESLRPAVHMLLEDPILDLVIGLHREGFSSSWSPLSGAHSSKSANSRLKPYGHASALHHLLQRCPTWTKQLIRFIVSFSSNNLASYWKACSPWWNESVVAWKLWKATFL